VSLTWTLGGAPNERRLTMVWRETGGPPAATPAKTGFGTRLIERGLAGGLKALVKLDYRPEGLVFTLDAPVGETITEG
jgi:two-component sensor histidine kinase